jgi:murein DD-endopeptidase MepM/ murein hydrolase activator NlpD
MIFPATAPVRSAALTAIGILLWAGSAGAAVRQAILNRRMEAGQTLGGALNAAGVADAQRESILSALGSVLDFRRCQIGDQLRIEMGAGGVQLMDYRQSSRDEWHVQRDGSRYLASRRKVEIEKRIETVELRIDSSLYQAALAAGEDPVLPIAISDVFAWDIDFYQDVRKGDRVRAVIEKFVSKGRILHYGEILAAAYEGHSVGRKRVFRYQLPNGEVSYFQEDGKSARKAFLRSPLKYANVTSRFGSRFHPVLKYVRDHNGVDYGAAVGTPVWAVAEGVVTRAGADNASGKNLCLRHMNSLETCYLHLSGFASGVRVGARVQQKQVIAFTGNTGLTTAPHLHFALKRGGHFINPLTQKFPRSEPVPIHLKENFAQKIAPLLAGLEYQPVAEAALAGARQE